MIDFDEFLMLMAVKMRDSDPDEELLEAFRVLDKDGDGVIGHDELKQVMLVLGESLTDMDVEELIGEVDSDGDGLITYDGIRVNLYLSLRGVVVLQHTGSVTSLESFL